VLFLIWTCSNSRVCFGYWSSWDITFNFWSCSPLVWIYFGITSNKRLRCINKVLISSWYYSWYVICRSKSVFIWVIYFRSIVKYYLINYSWLSLLWEVHYRTFLIKLLRNIIINMRWRNCLLLLLLYLLWNWTIWILMSLYILWVILCMTNSVFWLCF
jgi:hypothetical protein